MYHFREEIVNYKDFDIIYREVNDVCTALMSKSTAVAFAPLQYESKHETELGWMNYIMTEEFGLGYRKYLASKGFKKVG